MVAIGYIYILSNPRMPGLIKIGLSERTEHERLSELSAATGVPAPFVLETYFVSANPSVHEKQIHDELRAHGLVGREFFEVSLSVALRVAEATCQTSPVYVSPNCERTAVFRPPDFSPAPKLPSSKSRVRMNSIKLESDENSKATKLEAWQRRKYKE